MKSFDHGAKAGGQLAILVPMVFECPFPVLKELEDSVRSVAVLEVVGGGMFGEVYPGLLSVAIQCGVEN